MNGEFLDRTIKKELTLEFTYVDLFYAFCRAKGIEDPECDVETEEEYTALEKEFEDKITGSDISYLGHKIYMNGMDAINYAMEEVERR